MSRWSRVLYLAAGWLFVALAAAGVVVPLLPTTPFLLLAGSCFLRSSPRSRRWLAQSRWFGPPLRDWDEHRAVRRPVKVLAVAVVSLMLVLALVRDVHWGLKLSVVTVGLIGLTVIWRLPTVPAGGFGTQANGDAVEKRDGPDGAPEGAPPDGGPGPDG